RRVSREVAVKGPAAFCRLTAFEHEAHDSPTGHTRRFGGLGRESLIGIEGITKRRESMRASRRSSASSIALLCSLALLAGCAKYEFAPERQVMFVHAELPAADRAVEAARSAGKAAECPDAFAEADKFRNEAWSVYWQCHTAEAIALANSAAAKAKALCPAKVVAPPPPPRTANRTANPPSIQEGACTTLSWTSTNASSASIDPSLAGVGTTGSQQVCPPSTTQYAIAATGPGGTARASTTVTVTPAPPTVTITANPATIQQG